MDFGFSGGISVGGECRRIAMVEVEGAISQLAHFHEDPDVAIHELRKHNKRIRSVLLLARPVLDSGDLSQANRLVRNAARLFSKARDAHVLQETCDKLATRFPSDFVEPFQKVRGTLTALHTELLQDEELPSKILRASDDFLTAGEWIGRWNWDQVSYEEVFSAVVSNYQLGYLDFEKARNSRDPEECHDWRKRAKYLSYHLTLLTPLDPQGMEKWALATGELASCLGEHHDLAVFESVIGTGSDYGISNKAASGICKLAEKRRTELEEWIFDEGKVIYRDSAEELHRKFAAMLRVILIAVVFSCSGLGWGEEQQTTHPDPSPIRPPLLSAGRTLNGTEEDSFVGSWTRDSLDWLSIIGPVAPQPRPGLGLTTNGRSAALSTAESLLYGPENAIDGDPGTYWKAAGPGPCSWQVDMGIEREVGAVLVAWKSEPPRGFEIESSRDGLSWRALLAQSGAGDTAVTIGFDPRPIRYLRISISETDPGFVPGIREVAAYRRMEDLPAAFPDFTSINGLPRASLATVGTMGWKRAIRLSPDWRVGARAHLPSGQEIVEVIPTASGEAFVLGQAEKKEGRVVHLATPHDGTILLREFLPALSLSTCVTWDGEWLYTLDGAELTAYRDTDGDGEADERSRLGKIFFPSDQITFAGVEITRFRAGTDGWFYAIIKADEEISGFNSRRDSVRLPRHGLLRFRRSGRDLHVLATGESALADFHFGKAGAIFVQLATDQSGPKMGDASDASEPEIRPLAPLAGRSWRTLPALPWPPAPALGQGWNDLAAIHYHNRLYFNDQKGIVTPIAEIDGLTRVAAAGNQVWFTCEADGGNDISFLTRAGTEQDAPVVWDEVATKDLLAYFSSRDVVVRTEGVFEIQRRKQRPFRRWERLLDSEAAPDQVEGVLAVLSAIGDERAMDLLLEAAASSDPVRQSFAFHHLGDHTDMRNHPVFGEISRTTVPAVTAAILSAMERNGTTRPGLGELVLDFAGHPDPTLAATSRAYLQSSGAEDLCFAVLDAETKKEAWPVALAVLSGIRRTTVVEGLIQRLEQTRSARKRALGLEALVALYYDDTVNRRAWAATAIVQRYLETAIDNHRVDRAELLRNMGAAGIPLPPPPTLIGLAEQSIPLESFVIDVLSSASGAVGENLFEKAIPWLKMLAKSPDRDPELRSRARGLLLPLGKKSGVGDESQGEEEESYRQRFEKVADAITMPSPVSEIETAALAGRVAAPAGDPGVGRQLFRQLACHTCHQTHGEDPSIGSDLAGSSRFASLPAMIDAILVRGEATAPHRRATVFELKSGRSLFAFEVAREDTRLQLRDRVGNVFSLARNEVKMEIPGAASLTVCDSAGLLSAEEFASLLRYLESLAR